MKPRIVALLAVAVVGMTFLGSTASPVQADGLTVVNISGQLGNLVQVGASVRGSAAALSGQGFDAPVKGFGAGAPGYCRFPLTGSLDTSTGTVTLNGTVEFSNNPIFVGVLVRLVADTSGAITFTFDTAGKVGGPFVLTGTGTVVIAHQ